MVKPAPLTSNLPAPPREVVLYAARPGFPSGSGAALGFAVPQLILFAFLLWAAWWPAPSTAGRLAFSIAVTLGLVLSSALVFWLLVRRDRELARGIAYAPFIRVTVTDRRLVLAVPWRAEPLIEIASARIRGGALGEVNGRGTGNAMVLLAPSDPSADGYGNIHFDRLPHAAQFVDALMRMR